MCDKERATREEVDPSKPDKSAPNLEAIKVYLSYGDPDDYIWIK